MDAALIVHELERGGFDPSWSCVANEAEYLAALVPALDVILADFNMPHFNVPRALELLKARELDIPLIVLSGSINEETAVQILKGGATDYFLKDRLARLGQAVQRARDERTLQRAKREADRALLAAEARTRFALEASRVGTWEADIRTGTARWSEMLEALHGLPAGGFAGTYEAFLNRVHPEDRRHVAEALERATHEHADSHILYRAQWPDGTLHWISGIGRTLFDESGSPIRAAGIGLDVTQRRALEEQYRQAQKMEAIGQLAGGIAHDFNNLLTVIDGYSVLIADEMGPEFRCRSDLNEIRRAAERATSLTKQLLAFSRRQILEPCVLDLRKSLMAMEPMLRRLIGEDVEVVVQAPPDVGHVRADPGQIEQVILNLALNARDAMPDGGTLRLEVADVLVDESSARQGVPTTPGHYVMLGVSDTGAGMDRATQARIFEPFFTTKQQGKGTGLGLATVYGIVKQSGGYIWVSSESGNGSTFRVYLPYVDDAIEAPVTPPASGSLRGSETILVVEDEEGVRELARRALQRYGYRILIAPTPREALDITRTEPGTIHLLLCDVVLPQMSGSALTARIGQGRPDMRVLYMSGYTDDMIVHRGVLDEGTPFLRKPFTSEALARKVREVLGQGSSDRVERVTDVADAVARKA
jgi:two-component system, cell cycle sensor histidine kinase and response regulator CckA